MLFAAVNAARRLNVDPELALRRTSARFVERVERAQELAAAGGEDWRELDLDAQDRVVRTREGVAAMSCD